MLKNFIYIFSSLSFLFSQSELSDRYTTYEEIEQRLNGWYDEFGSNIDPYPSYPGNEGIIYHQEIIGYSGVDNLPIWAIKLTMNADLVEDKPRALILGQCHAEEIYGVEIALDLVDWLLHPLDHPSHYLSIYDIMQNSEIWIVPTHNPEGLSVVHGWYDNLDVWNQDVYYRKNKYDANNNNMFDFVFGIGNDFDGVDLNRNYDFNWIFGDALYSTDSGCGANPSYIANYDYYRGPSPFSENEAKVIRDFVLNKQFLLSIAYHSSRSGCVAEKVIYPWEWNADKKSPDFDIISRLGFEMSQLLPKEAESGFYASASSISRRGNAHDWIYANTGCFQYLVEVGTENMQPNDINIIEETIEKNVISAMHLLKRTAGVDTQNGPEKYQITGLVTDSVTGEALEAKVYIDELNGPMLEPRYSDDFGRYRRLLIEGTYTIHFEAFGYHSHSYTFVPSNSQPTEYNVALIPKSISSLSIDLSLPYMFDEDLYIEITSDDYSQTFVNELNPVISLPNGSYNFNIYSENLFPEIFSIELDENLNIELDCKWKSTVGSDDFSSLDNWINQGSWYVDGGMLNSQPDFLYPNSSDNLLTSDFTLEGNQNYVMSINQKIELEWDHDNFIIYSSCNGCEDNIILTQTGHNFDWHTINIPFSHQEQFRNLNLNFSSDSSLNYRGINIDDFRIFSKPDMDCDNSDMNQDGDVDIIDVVAVVNLVLFGEGSSFDECIADHNYDLVINVVDIVALINIIFDNN